MVLIFHLGSASQSQCLFGFGRHPLDLLSVCWLVGLLSLHSAFMHSYSGFCFFVFLRVVRDNWTTNIRNVTRPKCINHKLRETEKNFSAWEIHKRDIKYFQKLLICALGVQNPRRAWGFRGRGGTGRQGLLLTCNRLP